MLVAWSFFQSGPQCNRGVESEPNRMFPKRNGFDDTWRFALIGDKGEPPSLKEFYRDAPNLGGGLSLLP